MAPQICKPYVNLPQLQQTVRNRYGVYGSYPYTTDSNGPHNHFTPKQLDQLVEVIAVTVMDGIIDSLCANISNAISLSSPTPDQIHKLFLDKLVELTPKE